MARARAFPSLVAGADSEYLARTCLRLIARLLTESGHSRDRVAALLGDVITHLPEAVNRPVPSARLVMSLPHVVSLWFNSPRYLHQGKPRPLPVRATGPCVAELIRQVFPKQPLDLVLAALLRSGALVRRGRRYVPSARGVLFPNDPASARIYALATLFGHAVAIEQNLERPGSFVQRAALHPHFPQTQLPALRDRARAAAEEALHPIDDFMTRSAPKTKRSLRRGLAGIAVYSFFHPDPTPSRGKRARRQKERSK